MIEKKLFSRLWQSWLLLITLLYPVSVPVLNAEPTGKHALLIGIGDYRLSGLKSLEGPINDVNSIQGVLLDRLKFQEKDIIMVTDSRATHRGLEKAFKELARRVAKDDLVYIHYCGHGSRSLDKNGDEYPGIYDQTWVPYGARSRQMKGIDRYDITDDHIFLWLEPILKKTPHLVFVSDSCYGAGVSRGMTLRSRSVPMNPWSLPDSSCIPEGGSKRRGIYIGAAQDDGLAYEGFIKGKNRGLFSWFWAQSLVEAHPKDSWKDIFIRTRSLLASYFDGQKPQFKGDPYTDDRDARIAVDRVWDNGRKVSIQAGSLSGILPGTLFTLHHATGEPGKKPPFFIINRVKPYYSEGEAVGLFKTGDPVSPRGGGLFLETIASYLSIGLPNYKLLPGHPFTWEKFWERIQTGHIKSLHSHYLPDLHLEVTLHEPGSRVAKKGEKPNYIKRGTFTPGGLPRVFQQNSLLSFRVRNCSRFNFYVYLLVIMADGKIEAIFPSLDHMEQDALLPQGTVMDLQQTAMLLLDRSGNETIKMIFSEKPLHMEFLVKGERARGHRKEYIESKGPAIRWAVRDFSFHVSKERKRK